MGRRGAAGAVAVLALAGCGGGATSNGEASKPAAQAVADALTAAARTTLVHVSGGSRQGSRPLRLDLWIGRRRAKGTIDDDGLTFRLIRLGDVTYVKGTDGFLKRFGGATAVRLFHGRWLKASSRTGDLAGLAPLTDLAAFVKGILVNHGRIENAGEATYDGQKAVKIRDTTEGGALYIAATGPPYPIALVGTGSEGTVRFTDWNADVAIAAPGRAVDLSKIR